MYEKTTVPMPPAGTGGEQPSSNKTNQSIADNAPECNDYYEDLLVRLRRTQDPAYLHTLTMRELFENVYQPRPSIVEGLLWPGTYLFVGAPKVGKSFLVAQIAYHVSTGLDLWGYPVRQGPVLYLALEDDYRRLQNRLYRMFGTDSAENLHFAIQAKQLSQGLMEQLQKFLREHPQTRLVIIDTLQKIREAGGESYSYASDYELIGRLKQFADQTGICLLLVHHTRKQQAEDKFDMISGTNGLLGAADGAFLLRKEQRIDGTATLEVSGRDQQEQRLYLSRDPERLVWQLERTETDLWQEPPDPVVQAVAQFITPEQPRWEGTATELAAALGTEIKPISLSMRLNVRAGTLLTDHHIRYETKRSHDGRKVTLTLELPEA